MKRVSLILPCRNEASYIRGCLDSILAGTYPHDRLELFVVDGRSDDATRDIVAEYAERYPWIQLVDNPERIVPSALNLGVRQATGDIIARVDAHAIYPPDYLSLLVEAMVETGADNVGGRVVTVPSGKTAQAQAIAFALAHPFGVGNSYFRIGSANRRWTDTVPYGCYRREVFDRIGLFDEDLVRNQDEEFNYRLIGAGGRVLLLPEVASLYFARESCGQAARMLYQYGYFKPLVAQKLGRVFTARQLVPPAFVAWLILGPLLAALWPLIGLLWMVSVLLYAATAFAVSLPMLRTHGLRCALMLSWVFPVLHVAYGSGFWRGLWDLVAARSRRWREAAAVPLTR